MSENKLIFLSISSSIFLVITIILLGKAWESPNTDKYLFIPFLLLFLITIGFYFYDKSNTIRDEQQSFSKKILDAREAEKKKIAGELHDGLQQDLHFIGFEIKNIQKTTFTPKEKLEEISSRILNSIDEVRRISSELYPHQLENLGLKKALIGMANNVSDLSDVYIKVNIENEIDDLFSQESSIHIYRIVQELLNNIIKHSNASNAKINMSINNTYLYIDVEDDGVGLENNFKKVDNFRNGLGISSINERMKLMNGSLVVKSQPGKGTSFKMVIPIRNIYNT